MEEIIETPAAIVDTPAASVDLAATARIVEALLLAADGPLSLDALHRLVGVELNLGRKDLREALGVLAERYADSAAQLCEVASGWRLQVRPEFGEWVGRLWQEKPPKYSRAALETLALVVYRQPITRGEIEDIRGVAVSTNILRTLLERGWVREVGVKETPGRPSLYGTTSQFLDDFNLRSLDQLPALPEIKDLEQLEAAMNKLGLSTESAASSLGALAGDSGTDVDDADADDVDDADDANDADDTDDAAASQTDVEEDTTANADRSLGDHRDAETARDTDAHASVADDSEHAHATELADEAHLAEDASDESGDGSIAADVGEHVNAENDPAADWLPEDEGVAADDFEPDHADDDDAIDSSAQDQTASDQPNDDEASSSKPTSHE